MTRSLPARACLHPAPDSARRTPRGLLSPILILATLLVVSGVAIGDPAEPPPLRPKELTSAQRDRFERPPVPLIIDSLGLAMYRPAEALVTIQRREGQPVATIEDRRAAPQWSLTIQHLHSTLEEPTPQDQIRNHLDALRAADQQFRILHNEPFEADESVGQLCYIEQPTPHGELFVNGWLILPAGNRVFLVFSILTLPEALTDVRRELETSFETIRFRSAPEMSLRRRSNIEVGRRFLESITPDDLKALAGQQQWYRIYQPADRDSGTEEAEVGYTLIEVTRGPRGMLDPERSEESYRADERQEGLFVRMQARLIGDASRSVYYDSLATYWMAWDQGEEAWSIRGTQRQRQAERSEAETGVRTRQSASIPRPTLTVVRMSTAHYMREPHEWHVPEVYLSQAIAPLLGKLLPMDEAEPLDLTYYFYNYTKASPQLTLRTDTWRPAEDRSGNWILSTRLTSDSAPSVSIYSSDRRLLRRTRPDGTVTEPITLDQLHRLWSRQGLDVGRSRR